VTDKTNKYIRELLTLLRVKLADGA
jgi:hypothetical protein